ncbi:MAG TPA: hypothetical protein VG942_07020 [Hyphomonadaceae bacterium]|nr:hypothetical protein [Hyphomonadaceae bacterium]
MMIAHCSIPADDPKKVAAVLAEIMGGEAVRFPPGGPDAYKAWSGDGLIDLEVVKRGSLICYGAEQAQWRPMPTSQTLSEVHVAIAVDRPEHEVIAIARKAGWPARHCERGNGYFSLAEVWVEGSFMIEFMDPAQTRIYRERVTLKNWKEKLVEMGAA